MKFKLNLQLFANHVNVTTDATSGNNLSVEMKTFYDMTLIDEASAQLVHDQFGQKRPIPKNGGKTIEFRKFASLPKALTPLTEGVTPDGKKLDFLVQEMNREANTIGSKANDITITNYMLEIKSEIEKIREQVQNIE